MSSPPPLGLALASCGYLLLVSVLQGELPGDPRARRPQGLPWTEGETPRRLGVHTAWKPHTPNPEALGPSTPWAGPTLLTLEEANSVFISFLLKGTVR